ncbi:hypothetical protein LTR50_002189 [Elasticomyces elasticus]|nr:hypothetical protein LTR50_002189 [Elasticomyces elasticus]
MFTTISGFAFANDTASYLLMLAIGTFCLVFVGMFFLQMKPPTSSYEALPIGEGRPPFSRKDSNPLQRTKPGHSKHSSKNSVHSDADSHGHSDDLDERSSLMSGAGDLPDEDEGSKYGSHHAHRQEITGMALLPNATFWQLFIMLSLLCGVGLMTINNIGNNAKALWHHYDDTASPSFIQKRQLLHVSFLSFMSFVGRLASGIGSDLVVKRLHGSRFWSLVASAFIFVLAQIAALVVVKPQSLFWVSGLTGLGYGALFGVYPALVADAFGVKGLSLNWGAMTMAPVLSGNIFNLAYGRILDMHSEVGRDGERQCSDGRRCYSSAYYITLAASAVALVWTVWSVRHEFVVRKRERRMSEATHA